MAIGKGTLAMGGRCKSLRLETRSSRIKCPSKLTAVLPKKLPLVRRVWRMTPDTPSGKLVDFDPTESAGAGQEIPARVLDPAPVVDWRGSSFDLLNGVEVRDHSDSIPAALFERLFKR